MKTTLNELAAHCHNEAKQKGWYDKPRPTTELLMLVVCEAAEAVEADRKNRHCEHTKQTFDKSTADYLSTMSTTGINANLEMCENAVFKKHIKDTFQDEISDTMIRLLDLCGYMGIDIDFHIQKKLQFNRSRPQKHGKAY